jgi:hypothetical protein
VSVIAVGPALDLDGPLPVSPPHSLLSIPGVLVSDDEESWLNGVNVYGYPDEVPLLWEPCSTGTYRTKSEGGPVPLPRFDSFVLYLPITCSSLSIGNWRDFAERAESVLEATQSFGVEEALSQGVDLSANPFLGDTSVTVLGGGAVTPEVGLRWLERAIGQTGQAGLIHAPPEVSAAWGFEALYIDDDGVLRTVNGTPVAVGGGYQGASANGASPASGSAYAFASGSVQVRLSEMQLIGDDINGSLDTLDNTVTFRAERYALATWDTALQVAVLIDWTP